MKVWRDSSGRWIDGKEFKSRFAKGVEGVTPLQQTRSQLVFMWITVIGILCGIAVSIWKLSSLWWLGIILLAGLGNTVVGMIGVYQKFQQLKRVNEMIKQSIIQEHREAIKKTYAEMDL